MIGAPASTPGMLPAKAPPPRAEAAARPAAAPPPLREGEQVPMPAEVSFGDFLSALNPLHHIPVVGWIYRQVTGETIQPVFRVLGGLVAGGPIGAIASAVGALAEQLLGDADMGQGPAAGTAIAAAAPPAAAPPPAAPPPTAAGAAPSAAGAAALAAASAAVGQASGSSPGASPGSLAAIVTASGQPLQPLPLATRLAARAYPAPSLPMREAAAPPDPVAAAVPAASRPAQATLLQATPGQANPGQAAPALAEMPGAIAAPTPAPTPAPTSAPTPEQAMPGAAAPARVRRAPVVPITAGGQDPAFVQQMMRGLEAYERSMRARTAPQAAPAAP